MINVNLFFISFGTIFTGSIYAFGITLFEEYSEFFRFFKATSSYRVYGVLYL